jgi:anti-sigma factor ChrR (cupin superfamily)
MNRLRDRSCQEPQQPGARAMSGTHLEPEVHDPSYVHLPSTVVDSNKVAWQPTKYPGIDVKVLLDDPVSGLLTALFRWAPGSVLPLHEHTGVEQTYVLEGSFEDADGVVTAGQYVSRPPGSRHVARSRGGAVMLSIFQSRNVFFGANGEKEVFGSKRS